METPSFVVLPEGLLRQLSNGVFARTIEEARAMAQSFTSSGHEAAFILQPLSIIERSKETTERTLFTLAHDTAGALLEKAAATVAQFLSDASAGAVSSMSNAQLALVADAAEPTAQAAATVAQADGHADQAQGTAAPQCGFVADDGRVCVAMPHDEGGHLLVPPVTDATRSVITSGQP